MIDADGDAEPTHGHGRAGLEDLVGSAAYPRALARGGAAYTLLGATGILVGLLVPRPDDPGLELGPAIALLVSALLGSAALWRWGPAWRLGAIRAAAVAVGAIVALGVGLLGPGQAQSAAAIAAMAGPMFFFLSRRTATAVIGASLLGYALVLAIDDGYPGPVGRWIMVAGLCGASAFIMGWIGDRLRNLAHAERRASAEVARLNDALAERVDDLGRFLSPHVAAAIRDSDGRSVLEPHRRQIGVLFVDLRRFTAFTAQAEPEDVLEVLGELYAAVGALAHERGATIGGFLGDAVMAYFGDPVPDDNPAGSAVSLALALRVHLDELCDRWERRGFELGYGIGVALGYATLGVVGYEGRHDYTAIGTVVNLASRLSGAATDGEILLDQRARQAADDEARSEPRTLRLKGLSEPVVAYALPPAR